jgi:hypothetical protein
MQGKGQEMQGEKRGVIMSFLFFVTPSDKTGKAIIQAIKTQFPDESVDFCATAGSLSLKLSEHRNDQKVAILVPADEEELIDIYSMKDLFNGVPIMLVLPNRDEFVEAMGHRLKPKLMIHEDSGVVRAVSKLHNMVGNTGNFKAGNMPSISE